MKITLTDRENGKVITLITSDTYMFDLPCIGSDGMMYNLHKIWRNEHHRHTDSIVIIDEQQGYFISTYNNIKNEHVKYDFYVKEIFDFANNIDSYIMLYEFYKFNIEDKNKYDKIKKIFDEEDEIIGAAEYNVNTYDAYQFVDGEIKADLILEDYSRLNYVVGRIKDVIKNG